MATTTSVEERNREIVERVSFEPYVTGEMDAIDEMVSEGFVLHDPLSPEEIRGPERFKEYVESFRTAFPDLHLTTEEIVAEDDRVAVHWTVGGTHEGPIPNLDLEPTGEEFEISGMEFDRIEDGKLAETWLVYDSLGFMQQLGVIPTEEDAGAQ
ncbi:ester cyclase [Natronorarus salvus]|uniref:ester cyclase n=1 Tax=Natronorarus salvus TaxID=3117733 RepID=UPI002F2675F7